MDLIQTNCHQRIPTRTLKLPPDLPPNLYERATSPDVILRQHRRRQTVLGDDHQAAAIIEGSTQHEEEWEITNNISKAGALLLTLIWPS